MKALVVHVPYQVRGGEDVAVESQKKALEALGYEVSLWPNDRTPPKLDPIRILASLNGSDQWKELENEFARERPKFAILNNIYPIYGPRLLRFLNQKKIPLFFAIHNHRLYCTNGLAMRDGSVCKLCKNSSPFRSVAFNCNQNYMRSIYYATALSQIRRDRLLGSLQAFVAPSPYIGEEIKSLGIPMEKIHWIVNPVLDVSGG
ncbi:MAG TPA: glycosyltransferase, partial [Oligoflexia bacterium]|nr:glycosyltransferase [Oligoflexia bacterium]